MPTARVSGGPSQPAHHVALLRAVNVGGRSLPMAELAAIFLDLGASEVQTYIQSGNVLFAARPDDVARIVGQAVGAIRDRHGYDAPMAVRTLAELHAAIAANPFAGAERGAGPEPLHVMYLDRLPDPARVAALDPDRSPPGRFAVVGREVFLHLPHGAGQSKLTVDWFDRQLGVTATARNWRTTQKLRDLLAERG